MLQGGTLCHIHQGAVRMAAALGADTAVRAAAAEADLP